jgi:hypothetical protein
MEKLLFGYQRGWMGRAAADGMGVSQAAWLKAPKLNPSSTNLVTHSWPPRLHRSISNDRDNPDDSVELSPAQEMNSAPERRGVSIAHYGAIGNDGHGRSHLNLVFTLVRVAFYCGGLASKRLQHERVGDGPADVFVVGDGGRVVAHLA